MAYITTEDVEDLSGFGYKDMKTGGSTMTQNQWDAFVPKVIARVEARVHKYCNVVTFEEHEVVEMHEGRWPQDPAVWPRFPGAVERAYLSGQFHWGIETVFFPRELPVLEVTKVEEDLTTYGNLPDWVERVPRHPATTDPVDEGDAGDYEVFTRMGMTWIQFHRNVPRGRPNNLRITYTAGYASGSQELADIQDIVLRMVTNYLVYKRRLQEYQTLRATGVPDYQKELEDFAATKWIMTAEIKIDLNRHVQKPGLSPDLFSF